VIGSWLGGVFSPSLLQLPPEVAVPFLGRPVLRAAWEAAIASPSSRSRFIFRKKLTNPLLFVATGVSDRHAPSEHRKDSEGTTMTSAEATITESAAAVAEQGSHVAPEKTSSKKGARLNF
jgi:hypothetical protein